MSGKPGHRVSEYNVLTGRFTDPPDANVTFDDPLCDAPGYLDPLHPGKVSLRCQLIAGHGGTHYGYLPVHWPAAEEAPR